MLENHIPVRQPAWRRMLAPCHFYCKNDAMRGTALSLGPAPYYPRRRVNATGGPLAGIMSALLVALCFFGSTACAQDSILATSPYYNWPKGPPPDATFFPIAVWLQSPLNADKYRAAGINTYVGLWQGPTEEQLSALSRAGMRLICEQNQTALRHLGDQTIIGWMHGDEPDNAQELPNHAGYGPPVSPEKIVQSFRRLRDADPSRPVMLNLGQGVAWDEWYGRGSRSNHRRLRGLSCSSIVDLDPVSEDRHQQIARGA